jgi:hypothetical protein
VHGFASGRQDINAVSRVPPNYALKPTRPRSVVRRPEPPRSTPTCTRVTPAAFAPVASLVCRGGRRAAGRSALEGPRRLSVERWAAMIYSIAVIFVGRLRKCDLHPPSASGTEASGPSARRTRALRRTPAGVARARVGSTSIYVVCSGGGAGGAGARKASFYITTCPLQRGRTIWVSAARRVHFAPVPPVAAHLPIALRPRHRARGHEIRRPGAIYVGCTSAGGLNGPPSLKRIAISVLARDPSRFSASATRWRSLNCVGQ